MRVLYDMMMDKLLAVSPGAFWPLFIAIAPITILALFYLAIDWLNRRLVQETRHNPKE